MVLGMNASPAALASRNVRPEAVRAIVIGGLAATAAIGLLLAARRTVGAFTHELTASSLLATLIVAATVIFGGRLAWRQSGSIRRPRSDAALAWSGTVSLVLLCAGCAWPTTRSYAWLIGLPLVGADHYSRRKFLTRDENSGVADAAATEVHALALRRREPSAPVGDGEVVLQQLIRVRANQGDESIHGTLRTDLETGQRHTTLYVGFCPPLERQPDVDVEQVEGPEAALKVAQAFAHGVRIDVRLSEPAEEACSVVVELAARPSSTAGPIVPPKRPPV
jgi:hypothetical protein